ncbi:oxidoreductase [Gordonia sp. HNM0687]|uniref:Oxidoreductase n=1 Tax=Gordonia mangrovi TaxID=2665643 RepID=A0A6L7GR89_9ACTN|nr:FAD-binding oxidoreductase [Gordonia mangrovi]MXP22459.1 oxidoreductase [Gordonia mangrovi]UVF77665.1 FAD-binding oxidoreductase [Gordonia mangrovi]
MSEWQVTTVISQTRHSDSARSLRLALSEPFTALPGQHLDIRLTAEDGYSTARTYSLSDTRERRTVEVTVERADDGEVSPYLVDVVEVGEPLEVTRPHGGWFTWDGTSPGPIQLIAGGSGLGPLMSMIRHREIAAPTVPFNLVYSLRSPDRILFGDELRQLIDHRRLPVRLAFTRRGIGTGDRPTGRLGTSELTELAIHPDRAPTVFICGPTAFVEHCAAAMVGAGHRHERIRTERFG